MFLLDITRLAVLSHIDFKTIRPYTNLTLHQCLILYIAHNVRFYLNILTFLLLIILLLTYFTSFSCKGFYIVTLCLLVRSNI